MIGGRCTPACLAYIPFFRTLEAYLPYRKIQPFVAAQDRVSWPRVENGARHGLAEVPVSRVLLFVYRLSWPHLVPDTVPVVDDPCSSLSLAREAHRPLRYGYGIAPSYLSTLPG